ncbi:hypothetical protein [Arthrobacter globiformis]|uniref:hypothetical protein n=1 Tax=Arthrobacter globiformis TaxID=1665 RepID=UPI00278FD416|nr:hypothetical protein [Arthrobacter globiformis]MDQ0620060.1 hypothetical protein [Arthrobacter globiformis]
MKTGENLSGRLNVPLLRQAATCCLLLAAVTALANLGGLVLVIAGGVLPGWAVSTMLLVTSLALLLISRRAAGGGSRTRRTVLISLLHRLVVFGVGLSSLTGAMGDLSATYHVLEPEGPNGCRPVAREYSFLFAGSGEVYAVGRGGIGSRVSSWTADDGYEPIADGSYRLRWEADSGILRLMGGIDPVWPAMHEVTCG